MSKWLGLAVGVFFVAASPAPGKDVAPNDSEKIAALIERLASKNPQPPKKSDKYYHVEFPENYDKKLQQDVYAAKDELVKYGTAAFAQLVEKFDDERYSFSWELPSHPPWEDWYYAETVGRCCFAIVCGQVLKFDDAELSRRPRSYSILLRQKIIPWEADKAQAWWKQNSQKSLWELQADACRWAIDRDQERRPQWPDAADQAALDYSIKENTRLIKVLNETHKPIPPGYISGY